MVTEVPPMAEPGMTKALRRMGGRLAKLTSGALRVVFPDPIAVKPQGLRERRRRVRQIVAGQIPFNQLGGKDPLDEYHLAKKNYAPAGVQLLGGR